MNIGQEIFRQNDEGKPIILFNLVNDNGIKVKISNYGGIITEILAPDRNGNFENICLGFDQFDDYFSPEYQKANPYFGAIIGRYANRIARGRFSIGNSTYSLPQNNGGNTLHGGINGFDKKIWEPQSLLANDSVSLILGYRSPDGEEGFPGNLDVKVIYKLDNEDELSIQYLASSDKKTCLNLTNHSYFNLAACKNTVLDHMVTINADSYTAVDANSIPTGKSTQVAGSCFDFRKPLRIGKGINDVPGMGYDHNFEIINFNGKLRKAAEAIEVMNGRKLEVFTTQPGMQFYTGNFLDGSLKNNSHDFSKWMGFCFETQHFPDSPNRPQFPTTLLNPGVLFDSTTIYKFSLT